MLLKLIITRSEPTKTESLAGIEIESKGVSISKWAECLKLIIIN